MKDLSIYIYIYIYIYVLYTRIGEQFRTGIYRDSLSRELVGTRNTSFIYKGPSE